MIKSSFKNQIFRYLLVGGFSFCVEILTLYIFNQVLHISAAISVTVSFWVGFIVAYVLQKTIAFQNKEKSTRAVTKQLFGYSLLVLWNYVFTLLMVELFQNTFPVIAIRTVVIIITTIWNYVLYKMLFKTASHEKN